MTKNKKELRAKYLGVRAKLTEAEVSKKSKLVFQQILEIDATRDKKHFGVYLAIKNEVDTRLLIDKLNWEKKEIFLPRFFESEKAYSFVKFSAWKDLESGYYGIFQPNNSKKVSVGDLEVIFIPGVAFSKSGVRLGWGTGTYDKLLKGSKALKIGLAYDFQIAEDLPKEEGDIKVDLVITERGILKTSAT